MPERDWIARYFRPLATSPGSEHLMDDVARLGSTANPQIVTVDSLVEGVHFRPEDPIETVARKLVRVNVSDILASGAKPREAVLALGWADGRSESELEKFAAALGQELADWGIALIGGDTVSSPHRTFLSLTLTGECVNASGPIRRSGAKLGDAVWVTGCIGAARRGFLALESGETHNPWCAHYQAPQLPLLATSELIAGFAHAAMDVSDGLLRDASTLAAASGLGISLALDQIPFAGAPVEMAEKIDLATWGDDYQVLFTVGDAETDRLRVAAADAGVSITPIGQVLADEAPLTLVEDGVHINLPETLGFEHG